MDDDDKIKNKLGEFEDEICNRDGCKGVMKQSDLEYPCSCHISPPCSACTDVKFYCPVCDWESE